MKTMLLSNEIMLIFLAITIVFILGSRFYDKITKPKIDLSRVDFKMQVENIFVIKQKGTVVTGIIVLGNIAENDKVWVTDYLGQVKYKKSIKGIEIMGGTSTMVREGENVGLNLGKMKTNNLKQGDFVVAR